MCSSSGTPHPGTMYKWYGVNAQQILREPVGINQSQSMHMIVSSDHPSSQAPSNAGFQAIKKALNPSALASLEHLHDAWQRSRWRCWVRCRRFLHNRIVGVVKSWWYVPYQVQIEKMWPPQFQIKIRSGLTADLRRRRSGTVHCCRTATCLSPMMCNVFAYKLQWQLGSADWGRHLEELTRRWFQAGSSIVIIYILHCSTPSFSGIYPRDLFGWATG